MILKFVSFFEEKREKKEFFFFFDVNATIFANVCGKF
jgi:hypothetical protein